MNSKIRKILLGMVALLSSLASSIASAQNPPPGTMPTNISGVFVFPTPPESFDAAAATDDEIKRFGPPPRPNSLLSQKAYADWVKIFGGRKHRLTPTFIQTNQQHGPNRAAAHSNVANSSANANLTSINWSGIADGSPAASFGDSNSVNYVNALINVPISQQAFGTCTNSAVYSSQWIGIDGLTSQDVLQTGVEADALSCAAGSTTSQYYAWFEWYPNFEIKVTNLPITPGQNINCYIVATSSTTAIVYLGNYSTNTTLTPISITAPAGTQLIGNSVEWIVERPLLGGALTHLANYVRAYMAYTVGSTGGSPSNGGFTMTAPPTGFTQNSINMLDVNGNEISQPVFPTDYTLTFENNGISSGEF